MFIIIFIFLVSPFLFLFLFLFFTTWPTNRCPSPATRHPPTATRHPRKRLPVKDQQSQNRIIQRHFFQ